MLVIRPCGTLADEVYYNTHYTGKTADPNILHPAVAYCPRRIACPFTGSPRETGLPSAR